MPLDPIFGQFHWAALVASPTTIAVKIALPLFYFTLHGWFATAMAVLALFRPYEPWYFPGTKLQLPLTPGIFPKRQAKLATAVATTITDTLLTTADIRGQVESLLTEQNIYATVSLFVDSVLLEFRDTAKLHRLASDLAELSPTLLHHFIESTIDGLQSGKETRVTTITEKLFDQVIINVKINPEQSNEIASRIIEAFLTPAKLRSLVITILSPQNINAIDESIQIHAGGPYKILARIIGVKRVCYEWRNFLEKEPDESEKVIGELIKRFGIQNQMAMAIQNFDMKSLPLQSIAKLKQNLVQFVETFLLEHKQDLLDAVTKIQGETLASVRAAVQRFNPESIPQPWIDRTKADLSSFAYAYLKRELGVLLEKAIPALGMYALITRKIELFSPAQLEKLVRRVCDRELHWLEFFGGFIGFVMGISQVVINALFP
ncbi:MAG: DUF445 family protein [Candidatus Obscuribacterales bacterium]|nr:DUF445 family protein [Candidatus Obscuribacterales bacterium]